MANWSELNSKAQVDALMAASEEQPQLLFKHSTRCIVSRTVLKNVERSWPFDDRLHAHLLDLLSHRDVSDYIAELTGVTHQSPQAILIFKGKVAYAESHNSIDADEIAAVL